MFMFGRRGGGRAKWTTLGRESVIGRERGHPARATRLDSQPYYEGSTQASLRESLNGNGEKDSLFRHGAL